MTIQSPTSTNMGAAERADYNRSLSPQTMAALAENRKKTLDLQMVENLNQINSSTRYGNQNSKTAMQANHMRGSTSQMNISSSGGYPTLRGGD